MINEVCQTERHFRDADYFAERELAHRKAREAKEYELPDSGNPIMDGPLDRRKEERKAHWTVNGDRILARERLALLASVRSVARNIDSPFETYECVLVRLLDEQISAGA